MARTQVATARQALAGRSAGLDIVVPRLGVAHAEVYNLVGGGLRSDGAHDVGGSGVGRGALPLCHLIALPSLRPPGH